VGAVIAVTIWVLLGAACADADPPPPTSEAPPQHEAMTWSLPIAEWPGGLLSVSGTSPEDVWVVGSGCDGGATALRWRGDRWERLEPPVTGALWWVHALEEDHAFFGGEGGAVLRWREGGFDDLAPPGEATVFGVWARGADEVYAVGDDPGEGGFVWRWDGATWWEMPLPGDLPRAPDGAPPGLYKVWGDADTLWVVGGHQTALRAEGGGPLEVVSAGGPEPLFTVTGDPSGGEILAVGGGIAARVVRLAPAHATEVLAGVPLLQGVTLAAGGEAWASGAYGTLLRRGGDGAWARVDPGMVIPGESLHAVWSDASGGIWAVGGDVLSTPLRRGVLVHGAPTVPAGRSARPPAPAPPPGCEDPTDPAPPFPAPIGGGPDGDPALRVGTGRDRFDALVHGDSLRWEAGIQGGFHVWVTAQVDAALLDVLDDASRREVRTRFVLTRQDGDVLADVARTGGYRREEGGAWALLGTFSVLEPGLRPQRLDDEPLHLEAALTLPDGWVLRSAVWGRSACCD